MSEKMMTVVKQLTEKSKRQEQEIERLRNLCQQLVGEETLHQDGTYETEMQKQAAEIERLRKEVDDLQSVIRSYQTGFAASQKYWAKAEEHRVKSKEYRDRGEAYWGWADFHRIKWKEYLGKAEDAEKKEKSREAGDE